MFSGADLRKAKVIGCQLEEARDHPRDFSVDVKSITKKKHWVEWLILFGFEGTGWMLGQWGCLGSFGGKNAWIMTVQISYLMWYLSKLDGTIPVLGRQVAASWSRQIRHETTTTWTCVGGDISDCWLIRWCHPDIHPHAGCLNHRFCRLRSPFGWLYSHFLLLKLHCFIFPSWSLEAKIASSQL